MNDTGHHEREERVMNNDEQFVEILRDRVGRVAPTIDVDVTHVVPAARRRRAARVGGATLALGLVLGGGAWAAITQEAPGTALPGGSMTLEVEPSPDPSGPPSTSSNDDRPSDEGEPVENSVVVPDLTAMTVEDAGVACEQAHLTCTVVDTTSDTVPAGTVISSDPAAGTLGTWGSIVTLQLSTGP
ncbi:PASTA domain-containing protein [Promicromonospora aerolata]|uniref:PASTA domain-containing protein n=1 Tax=Promicromonospora aerolata TaxID=195749 RepID=A0ABW4VAE3_9MICO